MMDAKQAILARYRPELKRKQLYPAFHAAAADLAAATGRGYAEAVGDVFDVLAAAAGTRRSSDALGAVLANLHEAGELAGRVKSL